MEFCEYVNLLNSKLNIVKGIGEKKIALFAKLGIHNVWDLLYTFPYRYEDRSSYTLIADTVQGESYCVDAIVRGAVIEKKLKKNTSLYIIRIEDSTGSMNVKWFSSPFNKHKLKRGTRYSFYGTIESGESSKEMLLKDMEPYGENNLTGRIMPIYSLTSGLTQKDFRKSISFVFEKIDTLYETLPQSIINGWNLMSLHSAVAGLHNPPDELTLKRARERLAFEELFILSLALKRLRNANDIKTNVRISDIKCAKDFEDFIPFELTEDQKKSINDICRDLKSDKPMNRLIQGDVGSGKTAVAACAAYTVCKNGYQTAFMAPTEILANQHFTALCTFFANTEIRVGLLTGSSKNKKKILSDIADGNYDIVVGTHALIEDRTVFKNLGLCITDEQHRFGVRQRAALAKDTDYPNVLVMSATPIPRTLSLVLYGDLDISVILSLPSGRQKVDTFCVSSLLRQRLNSFIQKQIDSGKQCFVVCPLIEETEKVNALSGKDAYDNLCKRFGNENVEFLHGKMSADEKDEIMNRFRDNEFSILVSTTVIEVGIDIPNATLMIIENAERFGLSQLHQLRGRVGRGKDKSYCVLVSECETDVAKERMQIMCAHSDGFKIAEEDLRLRGCGEFFGTRQHGVPELKVANLFTDITIAAQAADACGFILKNDPEFESEDYSGLRLRIDKIFENFGGIKIFN